MAGTADALVADRRYGLPQDSGQEAALRDPVEDALRYAAAPGPPFQIPEGFEQGKARLGLAMPACAAENRGKFLHDKVFVERLC